MFLSYHSVILLLFTTSIFLFPDSDCKKKWQQLRSNFVRGKRKFDTHPSGSANIKLRKWVFYDTMAFLTPYVAPRVTSSNVPPSLEYMNAEDDTNDATLNDADSAFSVGTASNVDVHEEENTTSVMMQPLSIAKKKSVTKKRHCELASDVDEHIMGELQMMRQQAVSLNEKESDSDRQFLLSLLPLMKQLSPMDSLDIKIEIHQAFQRKLSVNHIHHVTILENKDWK